MGRDLVRRVMRLSLWALLCLCAKAHAVEAVTKVFTGNVVPGSVTEIRLDVPKIAAQQRLVFGAMRSTAKLLRVEIVDPSGRLTWQGAGSTLLTVDQSQTSDPSKGGVYSIGETTSGKDGVWRIRITADSESAGRILGSYSIRPAVELLLPQANFGQPDGVEGQRLLVLAMATIQGAPASDIESIRLRLDDGRGRVWSAQARRAIKTVGGAEVALPAGQYAAVFDAVTAGTYELAADAEIRGQRVSAKRPLVVSNASGR